MRKTQRIISFQAIRFWKGKKPEQFWGFQCCLSFWTCHSNNSAAETSPSASFCSGSRFQKGDLDIPAWPGWLCPRTIRPREVEQRVHPLNFHDTGSRPKLRLSNAAHSCVPSSVQDDVNLMHTAGTVLWKAVPFLSRGGRHCCFFLWSSNKEVSRPYYKKIQISSTKTHT